MVRLEDHLFPHDVMVRLEDHLFPHDVHDELKESGPRLFHRRRPRLPENGLNGEEELRCNDLNGQQFELDNNEMT